MARPIKLPDTFNPGDYPRSMALFEVIKEHPNIGKKIKPVSKLGICLSVTGEAKSLREAAQLIDTTENALYLLSSREHGKNLREIVQSEYIKNAGVRAIQRIDALSQQNKSMSVAMRASEWLAGVNGVTVTQKQEVTQIGAAPTVGMMVIHPDAISKEQLETLIPVAQDHASGAIEGQAIEIDEE